MKTRVLTALLLVTVILTTGSVTAAAKPKPPAKNIIVMVGDGWGFNHLDAASYYRYGKAGRQIQEQFPFQSAVSTSMAFNNQSHFCYGRGYDAAKAWSAFDYVKRCATDSAAAATALSTGVKTYRGAIGVDLNGEPVTHVLEVAEVKGKATGVVSSVEWTHATPAGFVAHNVSRYNYAGIGQEMVHESAVDVVMGAGHPCYDNNGMYNDCANTFRYVGGRATWDALVEGRAGGDGDGDGTDDAWTLIEERAEFQDLMEGPTPDRVLGTAQVYQTLQANRGGSYYADPYAVPFLKTVPTLEEMTRAALNVLDDDPDGFFLMVEGGAIDWASHRKGSGRMIEETIAFEAAIESVVDWVTANSNWGETLLIVTSDHETGYLTGPGSDPTWEPIVNNGAGKLPGMAWHSGGHTNSLVPLFAKGAAGKLFNRYADAWDPVYGGYADNTEVADVVFWAMEAK